MKRFRDLALFIFVGIFVLIIIVGSMYNFYLLPVSNNKDKKIILVEDGKNIENVITNLKENHLIRNSKVFKIYLSMYGIKEFKMGEYTLTESMNSKVIAKKLSGK